MRLTLRTLLAYRDGVLDAADAAALEAKIRESATAQHISRRIEEGMRNRKIAPIPVDAREFGFEANLVAEFLDDTIDQQSLPEMERKCLENNALLCEIGSCHQIISRALSVPAQVSNELREQIAMLPNHPARYSANLSVILERHGRLRRIDPANHGYIPGLPETLAEAAIPISSFASGTTTSSRSATATATKPSKPVISTDIRRQKTEIRSSGIELHDSLGRQVPEYLIGSDRGWLKRSLLAAGLLIALVSAGILAIGPIDRIQALLKKSPPALAKPDTNDAGKQSSPSSSADNETASSDIAPPVPKGLGNDSAAIVPAVTTNSLAANEPSKSSSNVDKATAAELAVTSVAPEPTSEKRPAEANPVMEPSKQTVAPKVEPEPTSGRSLQAIRVQWLPTTKESTESLVLKRSSASSSWSKMNSGDFLDVGEQLIVGPTQRTEFRVMPGIQWICAGDNDLEIASDSPASLRLKSGRSLVFATPDAQQVTVDCNGLPFQVQFDSVSSSCAIEVLNSLVPSTDQQLAANEFFVKTEIAVFGVQGNTKVTRLTGGQGGSGIPSTDANLKAAPAAETTSSGETVLAVGQYYRWSNHGDFPSKQELKETPWWFRTSIERPIDQMAINDLQRSLNSVEAKDPMGLLSKLASDRQSETAALSIRTRIATGDYSNLFSPDGAFNRKGFHIQWGPILNQIGQSLGRAENRKKLLESIQKEVPGRTDSILSLLIPKSQEQLVAGADKLLVESLSSSSMDERVLAIQQLLRITGKSLGYQPDKNYSDAIPAWRKALGRNEIRYSASESRPIESNGLKKVPN